MSVLIGSIIIAVGKQLKRKLNYLFFQFNSKILCFVVFYLFWRLMVLLMLNYILLLFFFSIRS